MEKEDYCSAGFVTYKTFLFFGSTIQYGYEVAMPFTTVSGEFLGFN